VVRGEGFDGSQFRFNDIELITDKRSMRRVRRSIDDQQQQDGWHRAVVHAADHGVYLGREGDSAARQSTVERLQWCSVTCRTSHRGGDGA